jgi:hypothetical protein
VTFNELAKDVELLAKDAEDNFLQLASAVRKLYDFAQDNNPKKTIADFKHSLKKAGIGTRKGYYLLLIDRVYPPLNIPRQRLTAIGWTKLGLLAKYTEEEQLEDMLEAAETQTVEELKAFIAGREPATDVVTLRFTAKQYGIFAGLLLANGAYLSSGGGLSNKEMAMMKVASVVGKAFKAGIA